MEAASRHQPYRLSRRVQVCRTVLVFLASCGAVLAEAPTVHVRLRTGGRVSGPVVGYDEHALVILGDQKPYVFAWREMELASALATRRTALAWTRGGEQKLTAEDWFALGTMALRFGRNDAAVSPFREAEKRDPGMKARVRQALDEYRAPKRTSEDNELLEALDDDAPADKPGGGEGPWTEGVLQGNDEVQAQLVEAYQKFGAKVQEVLGKDVALLETEHFLIWTDWEKNPRERLPALCEAMYAALTEQFRIPASQAVFAAKCPVFCFRSKAKFRKFAQHFDGYDGREAAGYTRSIERHGHVHVVLLRRGKSELDFEDFSCTLVHEGTHAFVHRLYSHRLIPPWVNEGLAELMTEQVLGQHCEAGEAAALLAREYAVREWEIDGILESTRPLEVHEYPLAHAVVAYLESLDETRFVEFIRRLKEGLSVSEALQEAYEISMSDLAPRWRAASHAKQAETDESTTDDFSGVPPSGP